MLAEREQNYMRRVYGKKKKFDDFVYADDETAAAIRARVYPKTLADVRAVLADIMAAREAYYFNEAVDRRYGAQCRARKNQIAVFFNEGPQNTLELVDAEYQP